MTAKNAAELVARGWFERNTHQCIRPAALKSAILSRPVVGHHVQHGSPRSLKVAVVTERPPNTASTIYALTGDLILQRILHFNFNVAAWVGYIALFGILWKPAWLWSSTSMNL